MWPLSLLNPKQDRIKNSSRKGLELEDPGNQYSGVQLGWAALLQNCAWSTPASSGLYTDTWLNIIKLLIYNNHKNSNIIGFDQVPM